jgi:hypothetical protein
LGKWDFDGDEALFFFVSAAVAVFGFFRWYLHILRRSRLMRAGGIRFALSITPIICLCGLWFVLTHWADPKYVVGQLDYQLLFASGGLMWLWLVAWLLTWFGLSVLDDALDRANPAAATVACGAMLGAMAIYAGSTVGSGPTIWTTIAPAFVATSAWFAVWFVVELVTHLSESIAIDRDVAAGVRHAGFLLAAGLILGRASAGDWTSWNSTFSEMLHIGWPVILLAAVAVVLNVIFRATPERPSPGVTTLGLIPAVIFVIAAVGYIVTLGPADIGKHVITYEQYMQSK